MGTIARWLDRYKRWMDHWRRREDLEVLWPVCKDVALTMDSAKQAFLYHVSRDPAWTRYYTEHELCRFVDDL